MAEREKEERKRRRMRRKKGAVVRCLVRFIACVRIDVCEVRNSGVASPIYFLTSKRQAMVYLPLSYAFMVQ